MDAQSLKKLIKLEAIIAETEPLIGRGRYRSGQHHDSLVVDTHQQIYFWNSRSGPQPGDVFTWLMNLNGWGFKEALADVAHRVGIGLDPDRLLPPSRPLPPRTSCLLTAPPATWQQRGRELVARAQATLWSAVGQPGLAELRRRGLTDETIWRAGLGWNPQHVWDDPARWGFAGGRKIWLARGLVIPWVIAGELWRIRVRRPDADLTGDDDRYISPRLYSEGERTSDHEALYNADALRLGQPAVLLEGELDCLSVTQAAGDLATGVATGSVSGSRRPRWIARLARAAPVLVAYDADEAGDGQARYWLQVLPEARRWRPFWADANQMAQDGVDLRAWISAGLP